MRNKLWTLALLALTSVAAVAQIPVIGSQVNSISGYQVNGAAPNTHTLCGNGTFYVDSTTPCTAAATLFYQTVDANGTPQTQRSVLNFSAFFGLSDSGITNVDPTHVGANATCTFPASVAVDVYGRTTACASGPTATQTESFSLAGCSPAASTDSNCQGTITLPIAMIDTLYSPVLTVNATSFNPGASPPGPYLSIEITGALTTTTIPYNITCTFGCLTSTANTIYVLARHN